MSNYIVDFYCHKLKLVIEVDGQSHDGQMNYDNIRTKKLESLGLIVIRYTNLEIMGNITGVYLDLRERLKDKIIELNLHKPL